MARSRIRPSVVLVVLGHCCLVSWGCSAKSPYEEAKGAEQSKGEGFRWEGERSDMFRMVRTHDLTLPFGAVVAQDLAAARALVSIMTWQDVDECEAQCDAIPSVLPAETVWEEPWNQRRCVSSCNDVWDPGLEVPGYEIGDGWMAVGTTMRLPRLADTYDGTCVFYATEAGDIYAEVVLDGATCSAGADPTDTTVAGCIDRRRLDGLMDFSLLHIPNPGVDGVIFNAPLEMGEGLPIPMAVKDMLRVVILTRQGAILVKTNGETFTLTRDLLPETLSRYAVSPFPKHREKGTFVSYLNGVCSSGAIARASEG